MRREKDTTTMVLIREVEEDDSREMDDKVSDAGFCTTL
jgi:hypothetical protein